MVADHLSSPYVHEFSGRLSTELLGDTDDSIGVASCRRGLAGDVLGRKSVSCRAGADVGVAGRDVPRSPPPRSSVSVPLPPPRARPLVYAARAAAFSAERCHLMPPSRGARNLVEVEGRTWPGER